MTEKRDEKNRKGSSKMVITKPCRSVISKSYAAGSLCNALAWCHDNDNIYNHNNYNTNAKNTGVR